MVFAVNEIKGASVSSGIYFSVKMVGEALFEIAAEPDVELLVLLRFQDVDAIREFHGLLKDL